MAADTIVTGSKLTAIANAIRGKTGGSARLTLDEMAQAVANIPVGATYTASSPLAIDANNDISIDLSAYATKQYVDDAIAALDDLSGVSF